MAQKIPAVGRVEAFRLAVGRDEDKNVQVTHLEGLHRGPQGGHEGLVRTRHSGYQHRSVRNYGRERNGTRSSAV